MRRGPQATERFDPVYLRDLSRGYIPYPVPKVCEPGVYDSVYDLVYDSVTSAVPRLVNRRGTGPVISERHISVMSVYIKQPPR